MNTHNSLSENEKRLHRCSIICDWKRNLSNYTEDSINVALQDAIDRAIHLGFETFILAFSAGFGPNIVDYLHGLKKENKKLYVKSSQLKQY